MSEFLTIFKTRRDYCRALRELSGGQAELISTDNYSELLVLLGHKQRILERMEEFSRRQAQLWPRWREQRNQLPQAEREACEAVLADTEAILSDLNQSEQSGADELARRRNRTRLQLESLSQGVRAHEAYHDSTVTIHRRRLDVGQ